MLFHLQVYKAVTQYNDKEHTTTGVAPNYAATAKYEDVIKKTFKNKRALTESMNLLKKMIK